ncbi:LysR family transcriptional regulator [Demequina sp. NBRC 110056]|uniref:LysR family transcriptional regulator n=1 Tax=Demequina sp. NBRC 110056 TaxID=1570345 RepID=UPI0013563CB1|nr:LysR family transcriptional regulator [Demequina sp. NBRC 110056]
MELRHLRYFAAVVEAGSLTSAAARLHMSQPPLSVAIQKLEAEVGVPLLTRSAKGVEPTSAGRFLLDRSARVLGEVDEIREALASFGAGTAGSLTLAAVPALMWHRIPALLREFAAEAPDVEVHLADPPPWTAIDLLLERRADVAAIIVADAARFAARHQGDLDIHDWGPVPMVVAMPPGTLGGASSRGASTSGARTAQGRRDAGATSASASRTSPPDGGIAEPLPVAALEGQVLLVPRRTAAVPSLPEAVDDLLRRHRIVPAQIRTVETIQTSLPLIEAGVAWALLPDPDRASLRRFDVEVRQLAPAPRPLRALALTRAGDTDPTVRRLVAAIGRDVPGIAHDAG